MTFAVFINDHFLCDLMASTEKEAKEKFKDLKRVLMLHGTKGKLELVPQ